jgi:hypothetical protein
MTFSPAFVLSLLQQPKLVQTYAAQVLADEMPGPGWSRAAEAAFVWLCERGFCPDRPPGSRSPLGFFDGELEVDILEAARVLESEGNAYLGLALRQELRASGVLKPAEAPVPREQTRDAMARCIEEAIRRCRCDEPAPVFAELQAMAVEGGHPPLLGIDIEGIAYRSLYGIQAHLTLKMLGQRLTRRRLKLQGTARKTR